MPKSSKFANGRIQKLGSKEVMVVINYILQAEGKTIEIHDQVLQIKLEHFLNYNYKTIHFCDDRNCYKSNVSDEGRTLPDMEIVAGTAGMPAEPISQEC